MKILTGPQIKKAEKDTIATEGITSQELMERASELIAQSIANQADESAHIIFFIGKGNNGGDGLAVARMLANAGFRCSAFMIFGREELSEECKYNYDRLPESVSLLSDSEEFEIEEDSLIIDAILGVGMRGEIEEPIRGIVQLINGLNNKVISIDIPSGMKSEFGNDNLEHIVRAKTTLTIDYPKLSMLLPEAGDCCGDIEVLPLIEDSYFEQTGSQYNYITPTLINSFKLPRLKFSHKGDYGHALMICGSEGMMGAAILATTAALRSGCGLVTSHVPAAGATAIYASAPSAMVSIDNGACFSTLPENIEKYDAIGVGCGLGQSESTASALKNLLEISKKPMVIDADALNIISRNPKLLNLIPPNSILTPHLNELRRLVGEWSSESEKQELVKKLAIETKSNIIVKGMHTMIYGSDLNLWFNSTGTTGMAKGGTGDLLTGLLTGLIARGYTPEKAAIIGVYIHGLAGEKAAEYYGTEGMNSADMIDFLADVLIEIQ